MNTAPTPIAIAKQAPAKRTRRPTPARGVPVLRPNIRRNPGIIEQIRIACSRDHRLATLIGALLGAVVPFATFMVAHLELSIAAPADALDPRVLLVVGGLMFSARTVYQWGRMALGSPLKAAGFTLLLEGIMVGSSITWLAVVALVYLCGINAIATGVTLARGAAAIAKPDGDGGAL